MTRPILPRGMQAWSRLTNSVKCIQFHYMCHHHPAEWPNPEAFDPERFLPGRSGGRHKLAWMPFGAGQRMCIGRDFALMEGQLALAMAVQHYRITQSAGYPAQPQFSATLRPKGGVVVKLESGSCYAEPPLVLVGVVGVGAGLLKGHPPNRCPKVVSFITRAAV